MPRAAAIIPARYGSTRLPGKPLLKKTGKFLIQHVYERVQQASSIDFVAVATDDARIRDAVASFGGRALMTSSDCASGTDRVAEAVRGARELTGEHAVILNVQGDEPEVDPRHLDQLVALALGEVGRGPAGAPICTLAEPIADPADVARPQVVKVVLDHEGYALYFSRSPIPHGHAEGEALRHIGIYAFERAYLQAFTRLEPSPLERAESLEQLRALYNGQRIRVGLVVAAPDGSGRGIDTPEDYDAFVVRYQEGASPAAAPNEGDQ